MGVAPLVGRDDLLRTLLESARAAAGGPPPTIVTLLGAPGYGKTHLAQMLVQHLEVVPTFEVLFVRAKEVLGGVEEQTARELLRATLVAPDGGAGRTSAARCSPSGSAPSWPARSGPAWR